VWEEDWWRGNPKEKFQPSSEQALLRIIREVGNFHFQALFVPENKGVRV